MSGCFVVLLMTVGWSSSSVLSPPRACYGTAICNLAGSGVKVVLVTLAESKGDELFVESTPNLVLLSIWLCDTQRLLGTEASVPVDLLRLRRSREITVSGDRIQVVILPPCWSL